jgi:hypothetical protein
MADMEFTRGDGAANTKGFSMPASSWSPGGRLYFAAKPAPDDDLTDTAALIKNSWGDEAVTDTVRNGIAYKHYACTFPPATTSGIVSNGADSIELLGEFEWVSAAGDPVTEPGKTPKLDVVVYMDIVRKVAP